MYCAPSPIDPLHPQPPPGLSPESEILFLLLPKSVRLSLLTRKDHEGRPALPPIFSEVLVAYLVDKELRKRLEFSPNRFLLNTESFHYRNTFDSSDIGFLYRTHDMNHHCSMPTDFGNQMNLLGFDF